MLSLESPRWATLRHAYGSAEDVPAMLRALAARPVQANDSALWYPIWSALCHQGTAYTASYAAVPHLVDIASGVADSDRLPYLVFVGAVSMSRHAPDLPQDQDLDEVYRQALARSEEMSLELLDAQPNDEAELVSLLQVIAALRRCPVTAELVEGFAHHELVARCPAELCGVELYVSVAGTDLFVNLADTARQRVVPPVEPLPASPQDWTEDDAIGGLVALAQRAGHDALAQKLMAATGDVACPSCGESFALWETLLDPTEL